jgi:hypothetical protein
MEVAARTRQLHSLKGLNCLKLEQDIHKRPRFSDSCDLRTVRYEDRK